MDLGFMLERLEGLALESGLFKRYRNLIRYYVCAWLLYNLGLSIRQIESISEFMFGKRLPKSSVQRAVEKLNRIVSERE
ncbi:hypothetical protein [Archaeoglobus sp.]